jgi:phage terminase large subunit GpA-like protein
MAQPVADFLPQRLRASGVKRSLGFPGDRINGISIVDANVRQRWAGVFPGTAEH